MYESFYGLGGKPFQLNPDASFFFGSKGHERAFSYLKYGVFQGEGFIVITGEVGAGKTTLVQALLEQLDEREVVAVRLVSTQLDEDDLLRSIAIAFGVPSQGLDKARLLAALEAFLTTLLIDGKRALLVVDEAQNLKTRALEELRMLSNLQVADRALLQSFLIGQPELREVLRSPSMQQLGQRIIASYHLGPLDEGETRGYVGHRLQHVGWSGDPAFDPEAFKVIHHVSGGIPRRINTFCNRLMLWGCLNERHVFDQAAAQLVADEIGDENSGGAPHPLQAAPAELPAAGSASHAAGQSSDWSAVCARLDRLEKSVSALLSRNEASGAAPIVERKPRPRSPTTPGPLLCVVGARPNYMKMAPLLRAFRAEPGLPQAVLVHTGQHYDPLLNDRLFAELELPVPAVNLCVGSGSHAVQTAEVMKRFEPVMDEYLPSCVVVVGDVNSTLACTLVAAKKQVPVVHVEAGLRSYDRTMPEEVNRVVTDQLAELLYTTERSAADNLAQEGIPQTRVHFVGNLMIDSLHAALAKAVPPAETLAREGVGADVLSHPHGFGLVTLHRPSNVDEPSSLGEVLDILRQVSARLPLIWPMHPRTLDSIERFGLRKRLDHGRVVCLPAQGYLEMVGLLRSARFALTDSGGVQEETTALGVPCLTLRPNTERPITVDEGTNTLVSRDPAVVLMLVDEMLADGGKRGRVPELWDGQAARRIAGHLSAWLSLRHRHRIEAAA